MESRSLRKFMITKNEYLKRDTLGYFSFTYSGYRNPGNPDFLNKFKNTFNNINESELIKSQNKLEEVLLEHVPLIIAECGFGECVIVCVPRAKQEMSYHRNQLLFKYTIALNINKIPQSINGTNVIIRVKDTKTTHIRQSVDGFTNTGDAPYVGITKETCVINEKLIKGKDIILIDDIYTKSVNIDEDAIQALYDNGARNVVFYAIAYTYRV